MTAPIRPVRIEDLDAVRTALVTSWHATYDRFHGAAKVAQITDQWHSRSALERQLDRPGSAFVLAEESGAVLGSAYAHVDDAGEACLRRLYVAPGAHGRGLGRAMLDEVLARVAERPAWLEVEPRNEGAIRFYEREGFALDPSPAMCGGRTDIEAVVMRRGIRSIARTATDADAQDLFGLLTLAFAEYPGCYVDPHDDYPDLVRPGTSVIENGGLFWVVEDARGRVRGCVGLMAADGDGAAELIKLYVRPDQRRRGLGAYLVRLVETTARARGDRRLRLWTDTRFTDAHRLYERMGFTRAEGERALHDISSSREYSYAKLLG